MKPLWRNDLSSAKSESEKIASLIRYIKMQAENQNLQYPDYDELHRVAKKLVPYYGASGKWTIKFHDRKITRVTILCIHRFDS